jgi:hypothetical protein
MNIEVFDQRTHELLIELFDAAEERMIELGMCQTVEADEYLTLEYIKTCGEFLQHAAAYLQSEGTIAADLFISKLADISQNKRIQRSSKKCALQLSMHTNLYFPNFYKLLTISYTTILHSAESLAELRNNGVLMLAAATLPGVRTEMRRELRRRGLPYEHLLVPDDVLSARLGVMAIPSIGFGG